MPLTLDPANAIAPMSLDSPSDNAMTALYRVALGPVNAEHYLPIFARFDDAGRTSTTWNWPAALFTLSWLVFRQLWGAALVYVAAAEGLALLVFGVGRQFLHWPPQVEWGILAAIVLFSCALPGLFANAVLHTEIRKRIARALSASRTVPEACALLERQASSRQRLSGVIIAHVVVVATAIVAYLIFPPSGTPEQGSTPAVPSATPAPNPSSGLAAVSVRRGGASTPAAPVASASVPPSDASPATAEEAAAPASVATAAALPVSPPQAPTRSQVSSTKAPAAAPATAASAASQAAAPAAATSPPKAAAPVATASKPTPAAASAPASSAKARASSPAAPAPKAVPASAASKPTRPTPAPTPQAASAASDAELPLVGSAAGFYINVGLFADEANARKAQSRLLNEGLPAFRQPLESARGHRIRVRVGPFDTKAAADAAAQTIQGMGLEAVVFKK